MSVLGDILGGLGATFLGPLGGVGGSALGNALGSAFTPSGTSANNATTAQQSQLSQDAYQLLGQLMPGLSQDYNYASGLEPQRQQDIQSMLLQMSPGNTAALKDAYTNQAFANASRAANQSAAQNQAQGYSPALAAGNTTAINNEAANTSNQYAAYLQSPEFQLQQGAARLNLIGQGQTSPFSSDLSQLSGILYGQPRAPMGPSYLGSVAPIVGDYLGNTFKTPSGGYGTNVGGQNLSGLYGGSSSTPTDYSIPGSTQNQDGSYSYTGY